MHNLIAIVCLLVSATFAQTAPDSASTDPLALTPQDTASLVIVDAVARPERNSVLDKIHATTGWATVGMGVLTGITAGAMKGNTAHKAMGYSAAALAAMTLGNGFAAHYGDIGTSASSSNNIHTFLGILGGGLMVATPFVAPKEAHIATGSLGTALMAAAVSWKLVF